MPRRSRRWHGPLAVVALALAALAACRRAGDGTPGRDGERAARPPRPISPSWVTVYDPALAEDGFTLTLHDLRIPVLLDLNGRPVHAWRRARMKSRVRLLPDGSILGIGLGRSVVEVDWDGRQTWEYRVEGGFPHHDVIRLRSGNTLVLVQRAKERGDTLLEVDRSGRVVWTWRAIEHVGDLLPPGAARKGDLTHVNSLQELPENPWFAAGDERFRPGNLLLSARNLNAIFIVDKKTGAVVWSYRAGLDRQHEALMNGPELPGPGLIQLFNNRPSSHLAERQSEVLEIDPRAPPERAVVWRYAAPGFFTPTGGLQQPLPNGNLLITSTRGGRVFEVTRRGEVAWEWVPPYEPVRAVRVARDFCPQLAALRVETQAVRRPAGARTVDRDVYRFAKKGARTEVSIGGVRRTVLADENACAELLLPAAARLDLGYGVDRGKLGAAGRAGGGGHPPRFVVRLHPDGGSAVELLRDAVGLDGELWRARTLSLAKWALRPVRLCVAIEGGTPGAPPGERFAYWQQPEISTPLDRVRRDGEAAALDGLTPEEREVQEKHLRSLGYIN